MALLLILFLIAVLLGGPVLSILSLNVLFGLDIPITIETYGAAFWLAAIISSTTKRARS